MTSSLFGQYLMERGIIDGEQLAAALEYQRRHNRLMGELAAQRGWLNEDAVARIVERQRYEDKDFGKIAVELGYLTEKLRDKLLEIQENEHIRLGDALVATNALGSLDLTRQLDEFQRIYAGLAQPQTKERKQYYKEDSSLNFLNLACKIFPRMTKGLFMPGGYYPTIMSPDSEHIFRQRLKGDLDLEVVFLFEDDLLEKLGAALDTHNGGPAKSAPSGKKNHKKYEQAVKNLINIIIRLYVVYQQELGLKLEFPSPPMRVKQSVYLNRRRKARDVNFVEVFLTSPPTRSGDLLFFHVCLLYLDSPESRTCRAVSFEIQLWESKP